MPPSTKLGQIATLLTSLLQDYFLSMGQKSSSQQPYPSDQRPEQGYNPATGALDRPGVHQASTVLRPRSPTTVATDQYPPPPPPAPGAVGGKASTAHSGIVPSTQHATNNPNTSPTQTLAPTQATQQHHPFAPSTFDKSPLRDAIRTIDSHPSPEPIALESVHLLEEGVAMVREGDPGFVFMDDVVDVKRAVDGMVVKAGTLGEGVSRRVAFAWIATVSFDTAHILCRCYNLQHNPNPQSPEFENFAPKGIPKLKLGLATFARSGVYIDELVQAERSGGGMGGMGGMGKGQRTRWAVERKMKADKKTVRNAFMGFIGSNMKAAVLEAFTDYRAEWKGRKQTLQGMAQSSNVHASPGAYDPHAGTHAQAGAAPAYTQTQTPTNLGLGGNVNANANVDSPISNAGGTKLV
ncbi:hypothetical protein L198_01276 [Cryptococcus wingfieldii CBS 7118]|uniref:Uncharacterized protein n=1 Tax=Cryptococcus wingfieldii CBS 7118 TaxID=1295528 RepID=A0A1E3K0N0_9TREE|nr:hypothetical protein L198_01276 [Cryptococcus wingfieldii CBS 7118]ODO06047.1 hypothetical protein L198_01276 [Cryptococcus wingfieldii CBS 7118]